MDAAPFTAVVMRVPLDRVTGLAMESGARFALKGTVAVALDGSSLDAARLFDFAAGGLRVVEGDATSGLYVLTPTGETAAACVAVGAPSPCLVPRLAALAHERLHTASELAATLSGSIELESRSKPGPAASDTLDTVIGLVVFAVGLAAFAWIALKLGRRFARDSMRRVRVAARRALRATRGDATLAVVRPKIVALVDRARQLDDVRRACALKLRRVDRAALDRKAGVLALAAGPSASAALTTLSVEREEAARLERELTSATLEIDRIESALRVVALRAGARDDRSGADPVDALVSELDLREQALIEANVP